MPPVATATRSTSSNVRSEIASPRPSRQEVVDAIREEVKVKLGRCNEQTASQLLGMLEKAVAHVRARGYSDRYTLMNGEVMTLHRQLDVIMPDEVEIPTPGSAHETITRYLATGQELAIVHTGTEAPIQEDRRGTRWYCQISLRTRFYGHAIAVSTP